MKIKHYISSFLALSFALVGYAQEYRSEDLNKAIGPLFAEDFSEQSSHRIESLRSLAINPKNQTKVIIGSNGLEFKPNVDAKAEKSKKPKRYKYSSKIEGKLAALNFEDNYEYVINYQYTANADHSYSITFYDQNGVSELALEYKYDNDQYQYVMAHSTSMVALEYIRLSGQGKPIKRIGEDLSFHNRSASNVLKVRNKNGLTKIYLNGKKVHSSPSLKIGFEKIGIEFSEYTLIKEQPKAAFTIKSIEARKLENQDELFSARDINVKIETDEISSGISKIEEDLISNYHALIICNNNYEDSELTDLDQPINDAKQLRDVLTKRYTFDSKNIIFLEDATRKQTIESLDWLSKNLNDNDNLIIFYAGHGQWDEEKETGYWLPVDAEHSSTSEWLRNSTIQGYIEDIDTKHTLLIADACFAGGIFKTRSAFSDANKSVNNLYRYESRKAMTSGMLNQVPDRSVFIENLISRLENNQEKYLPSLNLFVQFRENVMNNSFNSPQYGTIHNTGDQGGDFIFILKDKK